MQRPVLCGVDGSADALAAARLAGAIAARAEAPLILAHVVPRVRVEDLALELGPIPPGLRDDGQQRECDRGEALLREVVERLHLHRDVERSVLVGDPGRSLLDAAAGADAAVVVVAAHGHGRLHRAVLGSVSSRVAARATCPVVVVPHAMADTVPLADGPVLCAVDGSPDAERGARVAAAVAGRLGRELVLVHVVAPAVVPRASAQRDGWSTLRAIASGLTVPSRLLEEAPTDSHADVLAATARREAAACLVVGARGHGPLRCAVLGSVSADLMTLSPCPVVVVPPGARVPGADRRWGAGPMAVGAPNGDPAGHAGALPGRPRT